MRTLLLLVACLAAPAPARAGLDLAPGNLLLQPGRGDYILELTPDGAEDDWIWARQPYGEDLAVAADGRILFAGWDAIYRLDPVTYAEDEVPLFGRYDDIAAFGEYAYVSNDFAVKRIRLSDGHSDSVVAGVDVADVNVGLDGLLYVAVDDFSERSIRVLDPLSLEPLRTIPLGEPPCAVASGAAGEPLVLLCSGRIERRSSDGRLLDALDTGLRNSLHRGDLDVSREGVVAAIAGGPGGGDEQLVLTDLALDAWRPGGHSGIYVAFYAGESCHNGVDDDGDGFVDSADPEAACCGFGNSSARLTLERARLVPRGRKSRLVIEATLRGVDLRNPALDFYFFLHDLRKETHQGLSIQAWQPRPKPHGWIYTQKSRDPFPGTLAIDRVRLVPSNARLARVEIEGGGTELDVPRAGKVGVSFGFRDPNGQPDLCAAAVERFEARGRGIGFETQAK